MVGSGRRVRCGGWGWIIGWLVAWPAAAAVPQSPESPGPPGSSASGETSATVAVVASAPGEAEPRQLRAIRVASGRIRLDGQGDEPGWATSPVAEGFVQFLPAAGQPATQSTRVRVAYDDRALYVLVEALDSQADAIRELLTRRDGASPSDWISVVLDTHDDRRTGYRFSVNPRGVKQDARLSEDSLEDANWDAVWEVAVARDATGWRAEFAVPFSQLRYDADHSTWGIQILRKIARLNEESTLNPVPPTSAYFIRHCARLEGLTELPDPWRLELLPYVRLARTFGTAGDQFEPGLGTDLRVGIGSVFTLDLTVNPDFGQVEADPSELNLSGYETYLEEKRPFFLQGADSFTYLLDPGNTSYDALFYSRRIGGDGPGLVAAKFTGKTSRGWTVGVLDAVTGVTDALVRSSGSAPEGLAAEPLTQCAVVRVSRDLRQGQTVLGGLLTHLYRDSETGSEQADPLVEHAFTGGLNFDHRVGHYGVQANLFGSHLTGSAAALEAVQRSTLHLFQRGASHVRVEPTRTSLTGWGASLQAGRLSGPRWRGSFIGWLRSPELELNDLGFQSYTDDQTALLWLQYREDDPGRFHQQYQINVNGWGSRTFGGELTSLATNLNATLVLPDFSSVWGGIQYAADRDDPLALRGGPTLRIPAIWSGWGGYTSDDRRRWKIGLSTTLGWRAEDSGWSTYFVAPLTLRPATSLQLSFTPAYTWYQLGHQFVTQVEDSFIVGRLERRITSLTLRADWTLTPEFSVQLYVMPYLSSSDYEQLFAVTDAQAARYADRFQELVGVAFDRYRQFSEVRANLVLRWELAPGSALFLVWSHEQSLERSGAEQAPVGGGSLLEDGEALFAAPAGDTLMAKLTWWYGQ